MSLVSELLAIGVINLDRIEDEGTSWYFRADEEQHAEWKVDPSYWNGSGECSCPHFQIRIRPLLVAGVVDPHTPRAKCKHCDRVDLAILYISKKRRGWIKSPPRTRTRTEPDHETQVRFQTHP